MPLIQGNHNGRAAIVTVAIIDAADYKNHRLRQELLKAIPFPALIDTGATRTMIAARVVAKLNLQLVNKLDFASMEGVSRRNGYLFHVGFYQSPAVTDTEISNVQVFKRVINGGELPDGNTFDVLLGMDVITSGNLSIDKDGTFRFLF
jgi:gag-polyprotein putative aspartyl protease